MILQDVDDKYDKKNTLPFLANCKTRSRFWHLKNMADRGYGLVGSKKLQVQECMINDLVDFEAFGLSRGK